MSNLDEQSIYKIALGLLDGVGPVTAKKLVAFSGSLEGIFKSSRKDLLRVPGVGPTVAAKIIKSKVLDQAKREAEFVVKQNLQLHYYLDENYPERLRRCVDGPVVLYSKGNVNLMQQRVVSVVGTRDSSSYGHEVCERLVRDLKAFNTLIVSGMALGIDGCAHQQALSCGLPTVGVMAHGLDRVYPYAHRQMAEEMMEHGGLITEFPSGTNPDRENFPRRNRIVAGICDALIVVESGLKGGSIITAHIANSYNKDVFAVPGRLNDVRSEGCSRLIKTHRANLIESVADVQYIMGWDDVAIRPKPVQPKKIAWNSIPKVLQPLLQFLEKQKDATAEHICKVLQATSDQLNEWITQLQMFDLIQELPGNRYAIKL